MFESHQLQTVLLKLLHSGIDSRLGRGEAYLAEAVKKEIPQASRNDIMQAAWGLIYQGLAFIDYSQPSPDNWKLILTEAGRQSVLDEEMNPDNSGEYLERLQRRAPQMSSVVLDYAREALTAYNSRIYLASTVMLGVASEAAFLEVVEIFSKWLPGAESKKLSVCIENKKANIGSIFHEFRKRIDPRKNEIPKDISDNMALFLDSILDLLRINRNETGHPTGKKIFREDAKAHLEIFALYLEKLYKLRDFFDSNPVGRR